VIRAKVVLILGAGASKPYGFPVGPELVRDIVAMPNASDIGAFTQNSNGRWTKDDVIAFSIALDESRWISIDRFLQRRPDLQEIGKALIAFNILKCEHPGALGPHEKFSRWYQYLYNELLRPDIANDFGKNPLSIITYNYDRSLEYYFWSALRQGFGLSPEEALRISGTIPIVHVHGSLGQLPPADGGRKYGGGAGTFFLEAAKDLHIVSDDIKASGVLERCRDLLAGANRVVFLGFGFDPVNLDRLDLFVPGGPREFYGTSLGMTNSEVNTGVDQYFATHNSGISLSAVDCLDFLRNNRHMF
jgi:hypothetical protein